MALSQNSHVTHASLRMRSAFTLIELLVVIGIIAVLIGIAVPALNVAYKNGVRTRMAADLMVISTGLDAYRSDFADYPRVDYANLTGLAQPYSSSILAWALLAPGPASQDGADGPGFTLRTAGQGQVYGPYIAPGRFKLINATSDLTGQICDRYNHPYLYFPAYKPAPISTAGRYVNDWTSGLNTQPMYNHRDGDTGNATPGLNLLVADMQKMLGDIGNGTAGNTTPDGAINAGETAAYTGAYLLWGAGPDEKYGYDPADTSPTKRSDDVTNFNR